MGHPGFNAANIKRCRPRCSELSRRCGVRLFAPTCRRRYPQSFFVRQHVVRNSLCVAGQSMYIHAKRPTYVTVLRTPVQKRDISILSSFLNARGRTELPSTAARRALEKNRGCMFGTVDFGRGVSKLLCRGSRVNCRQHVFNPHAFLVFECTSRDSS